LGNLPNDHFVERCVLTSPSRPLPLLSQEALPFWEGCLKDQLLLQHCCDCGAINWLPKSFCARCSSDRLTWKEASGDGVLESFSIVYRPMNEAWASQVPYILALVWLKEGIRMVTRLEMEKGRIPTIDGPVRVYFVDIGDGFKAPFWRPQ
jgi:uncharacterized OB-fold protein